MVFDILNTDIYYINLDSQTERNEEFLSVMRFLILKPFKKVSYKNKI